MLNKISTTEIGYAQIVLVVAIVLQILVASINERFSTLQIMLIISEVVMLAIVALSSLANSRHAGHFRHVTALGFLAFISFENLLSLGQVLYSLIIGPEATIIDPLATEFGHSNGLQLLASAVAIFITNIIVFSLWYWEIDSPGLTSRRWTKNDQDFLFTQQDNVAKYPHWRPQFLDYLYLSLTNAINFAPADTRPITREAKTLMGIQALISVFTLAIVVARSVSILGS
jgi:hypothetical protein